VHRLGQQAYADLPRFLAGWDVALMPFALNGATRFISPTKTLEYFAAGIPVVSTPIPDVVETYRGSVEIARTPEAFVAACERLLAEDEPARIERARRMQQAVERTSWDATVDAMVSLVERAEAERRPREVPIGTTARPAASRYETVVIGGGPTGLSAAYHLGRGTLLLEREPRVGGWCRSIVDRGFTFDYAGHIMFSNDPYVHEMYRVLLGDNVHWQDREAWVYSKGVHTRYPFQGALYGLPPQVLKECIVGAIEARFGPLKGGGAGAPAPAVRGEPKNFEEFIYRVWGAGVARHFAVPYNVKLWTVPLAEMETSWLGGRVPLPDLEQMIEGALSPVPKPMGPNARFGYPLRGGFQALMDGFLPHLDADLELGASVSSIAPGTRTVTLADGRSVRYRKLVSTMPLPQLVAALGDAAPEEIRTAAARLRHVSVRCVNLGIGRANLTEKHWIYYPEDTVFHRIFVQGNASPHCNPPGGFGLTCEITYSPAKPLPCDGEALVRRCIEDCIRVGMIAADDPVWAANQVDMPYAYVVYDHDRARSVAQIRTWLAERDILLAGRYSEWEYYNSDHAFVAGRRAAEAVRGGAEAEAGRVSAAMPAQSAAATR
jgi:protoporphyrinogen oxidase